VQSVTSSTDAAATAAAAAVLSSARAASRLRSRRHHTATRARRCYSPPTRRRDRTLYRAGGRKLWGRQPYDSTARPAGARLFARRVCSRAGRMPACVRASSSCACVRASLRVAELGSVLRLASMGFTRPQVWPAPARAPVGQLRARQRDARARIAVLRRLQEGANRRQCERDEARKRVYAWAHVGYAGVCGCACGRVAALVCRDAHGHCSIASSRRVRRRSCAAFTQRRRRSVRIPRRQRVAQPVLHVVCCTSSVACCTSSVALRECGRACAQ
jgi:hypothetical protein